MVLPGFVDECWNRSHLGPIDLRHLESLFAVPILHGCTVSVTGLSAEGREEIASRVSALGGTYSAPLTKSCTHVLTTTGFAGSSSCGPKLQFAAKWKLPVVQTEWLRACEEQSMYVDERAYLIHVDPNSRIAVQASQAVDDVTLEEVMAAKDVPAYLDDCHIYLGDGLEDARLALLKRLILVAGGTRYSDHHTGRITHFIVHNQTLTGKQLEQLAKYDRHCPPAVVHDQWLLACFVARARLEPECYQISEEFIRKTMAAVNEQRSTMVNMSQATTLGSQANARQSIWSMKRRGSTQSRLGIENQSPSNINNTVSTPPPNWIVPHRKDSMGQQKKTPVATPAKPLFVGKRVYLDLELVKPFNDRVVQHGGVVVLDESEAADLHIYPLVAYKAAGKDDYAGIRLNEFWLQKSMVGQRLLDTAHPLFQPIFTSSPVKRNLLSGQSISPTGLQPFEREYYAQLTAYLGGSFSEVFTKKNTHLLCDKTGLTGPKVEAAQKLGKPCVTAGWLVDSARKGKLLDTADYPVGNVVTSGDDEIAPTIPLKKAKTAPLTGIIKKQPTVQLAASDLTPNSQFVGQAHPVAVDTPLRRDFAAQIKRATEDLLPQGGEHRPSLGPTQAIAKESLATLLSGLVFAISQRLWHRRDELFEMVTSLGGTLLWTLDPSCTHYLHQGNQPEEAFREFRIARHCGKQIVSPWWIQACKEAGRRLPEKDYPHTFNPNSSSEESAKKAVDEQQARLLPIEETPVEVPAGWAESLEEPSRGRKHIQYGPPDDHIDNLVRSELPTPPKIDDDGTSDNGKTASTQKRLFMFSSIGLPEKIRFPKILAQISPTDSACLFDSPSRWDPAITHLVTGSAQKTEKYLAACAAGIWVLRPEYMDECQKAGKWLPEADWEWQGGWTDTGEEAAIKAAPRNWRTHLSCGHAKGAFEGWTVLLAVDQKRLPSFSRILEAGKAQIYTIPDVTVEGDARPDPAQFTHVIYSSYAMQQRIPADWLARIPPDRIRPVECLADHLLTPPRLK